MQISPYNPYTITSRVAKGRQLTNSLAPLGLGGGQNGGGKDEPP